MIKNNMEISRKSVTRGGSMKNEERPNNFFHSRMLYSCQSPAVVPIAIDTLQVAFKCPVSLARRISVR